MTDARQTKDLIVVAADLDAKQVIEQLLRRPRSLGIRPIQFTVDRYVKRDSGCCGTSHEYLRPFVRQFDYAMVIFDRDGSGRESQARDDIETAVEQELAKNGWSDRSAAIVIVPELEAWVWSDSPEVDKALGWQGRTPSLRSWLVETGHLTDETSKPDDPKQAMKSALHEANKRPSPAIFSVLAKNVGTGRCIDPAFLKFKTTLQQWFPAT